MAGSDEGNYEIRFKNHTLGCGSRERRQRWRFSLLPEAQEFDPLPPQLRRARP
jgi:hypothetical protein